MQYFNHDTTASYDDKIIMLRLRCGGAAVDAYWAILEHIYQEESNCKANAKQMLAHKLCTSVETLDEWVQAMVDIGLVEYDVENHEEVTSARAMANISAYREKCERLRQNAKKGGQSKSKANGKAKAKANATKVDTRNAPNKINSIGIHKVSQILSDSVAESDKHAPLSPKDCPACGATMQGIVSDSGLKSYSCDLCGYAEGVA